MDLTVPQLTINVDRRKRVANIRVTSTFRFTPYEVAQMKNGLRFRAHAILWGKDVFMDDYLAYVGHHFIGESNPAESMPYTFQTTVGQSVLNED